MKKLIILALLLFTSLSLFARQAKQARVVYLKDCGDGTQAIQTYLDTDADGKYDIRVDSDCSGAVKSFPIVFVENSGSNPIPVSGPIEIGYIQCNGGDEIYSISFKDDNDNILCIAERQCDIDTVYVTVPIMQSVGAKQIDLKKDKIDVIYINNTDNKVLFSVSSLIKGNGIFTISDINGNILLKETRDINQSSNSILFDNIHLVSGVYFITCELNGIVKTQKFIISN